LIGGAFYRPERRGRGCPEAHRCGGPGRMRRATMGTAASHACWGALVSAAACCGSVLARAGWSSTCRLLGKKRGGPRCCLLFSSLSHGSGRGWGRWARPRHRPGAWQQSSSEQEQCSPQ
jgi:hypothetical protein